MDFLTALYNPPEPQIHVGQWYRIRKWQGETTWVIRTRAVAAYRNVVLFENEQGVRECFTRWELARSVL